MSKKKEVQFKVVWPDIPKLVEELAGKAKKDMLPTDKEIEAEAKRRMINSHEARVWSSGAKWVKDWVDRYRKDMVEAAGVAYPGKKCKVCKQNISTYGGCKCNNYAQHW